MMAAKPTKGVVFKLGASSPPSTAIDSVISVTPGKIKRDALDVSDHASTAEEFIPDGLYGITPVTVTMHYVAGGADDDACVAAATGSTYFFSYTVNAASGTETVSFEGVVTEYGPDDLPVRGKQTATMVIQPSGGIAQAATS